MRTRKDRGRITLADGTTEWRYGNYQHVRETTLGNGDICPERHIISDEAGLWDVDHATVGECTAAKDRNGNYVYEGDALRQEDADGVYVVFYNEKYTRWEARHTYGFAVELSQLLPPPSAMGQPQPNYLDAEIVGNIHDDPTLGKTRKPCDGCIDRPTDTQPTDPTEDGKQKAE